MFGWLRVLMSRWDWSVPLPLDSGRAAEDYVARVLERQGWKILGRRHRNFAGEIDLIARDGATIVFVEVKSRHDAAHGDPSAAVTVSKQRRIARAALVYLKQTGSLTTPTRFDVVSLTGDPTADQVQIRHFRHAFEVPEAW